MPKKASCLVDGVNMYHSLDQLQGCNKDVERAQFPPEIVLTDGTRLWKPESW